MKKPSPLLLLLCVLNLFLPDSASAAVFTTQPASANGVGSQVFLPFTIASSPVTEPEDLVQVGFGSTFYLRYSPQVWEKFPDAWVPASNMEGIPLESIRLSGRSGCILRGNVGRGVPVYYQLSVSSRRIGSLDFRLESWSDPSRGGMPVLTIYQYPNDGYTDTRVELWYDDQPGSCEQAAERVLERSADLLRQ